MIIPSDTLTGRDAHSVADTHRHRLEALPELGAQATEAWLAGHPCAPGERGSFSIDRRQAQRPASCTNPPALGCRPLAAIKRPRRLPPAGEH